MGTFITPADLSATSLPVTYKGKSMVVRLHTNEQFYLFAKKLIGADEVILTPGKVITRHLRISNVPDSWLIELL